MLGKNNDCEPRCSRVYNECAKISNHSLVKTNLKQAILEITPYFHVILSPHLQSNNCFTLLTGKTLCAPSEALSLLHITKSFCHMQHQIYILYDQEMTSNFRFPPQGQNIKDKNNITENMNRVY